MSTLETPFVVVMLLTVKLDQEQSCIQPETRPAPTSSTHHGEELVVELVPAFASSQSETCHKGSQNIGPAALAQSESSDGQTHQPHTLT